MNSIRRTMIAGALALPLMLGAAGIASADTSGGWGNDGPSYHETGSSAGPDGASNNSVHSGSDGWGGSYFHGHYDWAGPDGSTSHDTGSSSGRSDYGGGDEGGHGHGGHGHGHEHGGLLGGLLECLLGLC
jgi:hypothetical protein